MYIFKAQSDYIQQNINLGNFIVHKFYKSLAYIVLCDIFIIVLAKLLLQE